MCISLATPRIRVIERMKVATSFPVRSHWLRRSSRSVSEFLADKYVAIDCTVRSLICPATQKTVSGLLVNLLWGKD